MHEEKRKHNKIWYKYNEFMFRVEVKNTDVKLLIGEIVNFCDENDVESMVSKDIYLTDEWYE
jgi:hypothetical protein